MLNAILSTIDAIDNFVWSYIGVGAILFLGLYFSYKSGWMQIKSFPKSVRLFFSFLSAPSKKAIGIPPLYAFFASIGGCIGIGNIVGVCTAVQIGGPGAVFWMWVTGLVGMIVKYAEIYLGMKYRVPNRQNSYNGGPMIYLQQVFSSSFIPKLVALLLCIYGVEIYMFRIVVHSFSATWNLDYTLMVIFMLLAIFAIGEGGIRTVGNVSSKIIPLFLILFFGMSMYVFIQNFSAIPGVIALIFKSAFNGHAALGAFAGSSLIMTISQGVRRACYTGDLGIGYASVIHAESKEKDPKKQALLGMFGIFLDTFVICSLSVLLIVVTGVWKDAIHEDQVVMAALQTYFPFIEKFFPIFIFLLGYSSLIAFFAVGRKAALFLSPKYGNKLYLIYAFCAFLAFSYIGKESDSLMIMSVTGFLLLVINLYGMFRLRNRIDFNINDR